MTTHFLHMCILAHFSMIKNLNHIFLHFEESDRNDSIALGTDSIFFLFLSLMNPNDGNTFTSHGLQVQVTPVWKLTNTNLYGASLCKIALCYPIDFVVISY